MSTKFLMLHFLPQKLIFTIKKFTQLIFAAAQCNERNFVDILLENLKVKKSYCHTLERTI
jgi:hypothetical protein